MLKLWIQSRVDLHRKSTPDPILKHLCNSKHNQPPIKLQRGLDSSKLEHTWFYNLPLFDEDKSLVACVGFDWIWSSSCKNSIYTIHCFLQQQVRFSHVQNNIPDKQSVVSISISKNSFNIRDFSSFKHFQRKIHKNQSILPLFVFTNRL